MKVYVIGASGHGKVVIATLQAAGIGVAGLLDDDATKHGRSILGVPVAGPSAMAAEANHPVVVAVGCNATRRRIVASLDGRVAWATAVHPQAHVHPTVVPGEGTVVFAGCVIQPDTRVGRHVIVNTGATVDHDCWIGDYAHIAPGARLAGGVRVGEAAFLGIGASVIQGVTVGDRATLGAGAVATVAVPDGVTAVGVPARVLERTPPG